MPDNSSPNDLPLQDIFNDGKRARLDFWKNSLEPCNNNDPVKCGQPNDGLPLTDNDLNYLEQCAIGQLDGRVEYAVGANEVIRLIHHVRYQQRRLAIAQLPAQPSQSPLTGMERMQLEKLKQECAVLDDKVKHQYAAVQNLKEENRQLTAKLAATQAELDKANLNKCYGPGATALDVLVSEVIQDRNHLREKLVEACNRIRRLNSELQTNAVERMKRMVQSAKQSEDKELAQKLKDSQEMVEAIKRGQLMLKNTIDRLRRGEFTPDELQDLCHNLDGSQERAFKLGCEGYQQKLFMGKGSIQESYEDCLQAVMEHIPIGTDIGQQMVTSVLNKVRQSIEYRMNSKLQASIKTNPGVGHYGKVEVGLKELGRCPAVFGKNRCILLPNHDGMHSCIDGSLVVKWGNKDAQESPPSF